MDPVTRNLIEKAREALNCIYQDMKVIEDPKHLAQAQEVASSLQLAIELASPSA